MITIIDYGAGNINSVRNTLNYLGVESKVVSTAEEIENAERIIFPGVGSFGSMMKNLEERNLIDALKNSIEKGTPYLGICLGLQVLFEQSEESPEVKGLGILKGNVVKFEKGKIPQIGWNKIIPTKEGIFSEGYVYFVNSYYVVPESTDLVATKTDYFGDFVSGIRYKNITAVQFHPEKSGEFGVELLRRWLNC